MQGLGRTRSLNPVVYINRTVSKKAIRSKEDADRKVGLEQSAAAVEEAIERLREPAGATAKNLWADTLLTTSAKSFRQYIYDLLADINSVKGPAESSDKDDSGVIGKIDLNFGVEPLSYKNMWKVLKTVVKEISYIKEANVGRFFLGVSERLDKATTLMEYGSLADYLQKGADASVEDIGSDAAEESALQVASNPDISLNAQANIEPETALHLLFLA